MTDDGEADDTEVQHATVQVRVTAPVDSDADEAERRKAVLDAVDELDADPDTVEVRGAREVDLERVETMEEAAMRKMEEAESRALARRERQAERHFERRGRGW